MSEHWTATRIVTCASDGLLAAEVDDGTLLASRPEAAPTGAEPLNAAAPGDPAA